MPRLKLHGVDVEVDASVFARFEAMSPARKERGFTPEQDALIVTFWNSRNHSEIAKELGFSTDTVLKRYRELTQEDGK